MKMSPLDIRVNANGHVVQRRIRKQRPAVAASGDSAGRLQNPEKDGEMTRLHVSLGCVSWRALF